MLKAIKFYLLDDEDKQTSLEVESAYAIKKNKEKSLIAFKRVMPAIFTQLIRARSTSTSVFVNKDKELDIVDFNSGKVFYGEQEVPELARPCCPGVQQTTTRRDVLISNLL